MKRLRTEVSSREIDDQSQDQCTDTNTFRNTKNEEFVDDNFKTFKVTKSTKFGMLFTMKINRKFRLTDSVSENLVGGSPRNIQPITDAFKIVMRSLSLVE